MRFMKVLLFPLLLGIAPVAYSEPTLPAVGYPEKEYYENGVVHFEYSYLNEKFHGQVREFYETGEKKGEFNFKEGNLVSSKEFLKDGKLEREIKIVGGNRQETQIQYYQTGEKLRERTLLNNKLNGQETEYYQNGQLKATRSYRNDKRDGYAKGYHNNGKLQGDWEFVDGEPVSALIYYRSGELWMKHHFENGKLNGITEEYDKDGKLVAERYYEDDRLVKRQRVTGFRLW
ncbi:toxin-antitoxin system YwqK family antitoxin [Beggiatoa leptomitoformis]|nr:toxin-antitoxin system YwqK family antitoxin [Beggiatoa leptomitoformis]